MAKRKTRMILHLFLMTGAIVLVLVHFGIGVVWQTIDIVYQAKKLDIELFAWPLIQLFCVVLWAELAAKHWDKFFRLRKEEKEEAR